MRLLLVEDDELLSDSLSRQLEEAGFSVDVIGSVRGARHLAPQEDYRVVVLDLGLPDGNGLELLGEWRRRGVVWPVMILTARDEWQDKVSGLKAGADDYLAKPFQVEELVARLQALIRRSEGRVDARLVVGGFALDEYRQSLTGPNGETHTLTGTEFRLLRCLMSRPGQIFSKDQLLEQVYSLDQSPTENAIEAYIRRLRKRVGQDTIVTRRGQGYAFHASA